MVGNTSIGLETCRLTCRQFLHLERGTCGRDFEKFKEAKLAKNVLNISITKKNSTVRRTGSRFDQLGNQGSTSPASCESSFISSMMQCKCRVVFQPPANLRQCLTANWGRWKWFLSQTFNGWCWSQRCWCCCRIRRMNSVKQATFRRTHSFKWCGNARAKGMSLLRRALQ